MKGHDYPPLLFTPTVERNKPRPVKKVSLRKNSVTRPRVHGRALINNSLPFFRLALEQSLFSTLP